MALSGTLSSDVGIYVLVEQPDQPSDAAKDFIAILTRANLNAHYYLRTLPKVPEEEDAAFALYVAKCPNLNRIGCSLGTTVS
jgi:hypothetical protein